MYCTSGIDPDAGTSFILDEPEEGTIINCFPICAEIIQKKYYYTLQLTFKDNI